MQEINMPIRGCHYHLNRMGTGAPLVLLHGFAGNGDTWQGIQGRLAAQYDVIALDLLGHGQTDAPMADTRYTMEELSQDLHEILLQLGLQEINLLGYSMGGRLALYYAYHYPNHVRRLFLESSSPGLKTAEERRQRRESDVALARQIMTRGMDWFVEYWGTQPIFQVKNEKPETSQKLTELHQLQGNASPIGLANSLRGMGTGVQDSLWHVLKEISCKTTLICGANDEKFCTINKEMQEKMPHAEFVQVGQAGHRVHLECPDEFLQAVLSV